MLLIERHVKENFDTLYRNRDREINYNTKCLERDLDLIPYDRLTDRQKSLLDKDKQIFY
jgi:hypothetical protein